MAHLAKVTGRRDCKTFSLALTCHFVSDSLCFFSRCTMVSGKLEVAVKPAAFS